MFSQIGVTMATTKQEQTLTHQQRREAASMHGTHWRPRVTNTLTRSEWEKCFDLREGRIPPGTCDEPVRTLAAMPMVDILRHAYYEDTAHLPDASDVHACRQFFDMVGRTRAAGSGGSVSAAAFSNRVNSWVADGFREVNNSLADVTATAEVDNFHPGPVMIAQDLHFLKPLAKGGTAQSSTLDVQYAGEQQAIRMARSLLIDEQDVVNSLPGTLSTNISQLGRSAGRCFLDWAYSLILANGNLQDGHPIFDATNHLNAVTDAISDFVGKTPTVNSGPMELAISLLRWQHIAVDGSDGQVQHCNLEPKFLICTPELEWPMRRLIMPQIMAGSKIELRVDSRLTDIGVRNPLTGVVQKGARGYWLLSADPTVAPWLLRTTLTGQALPRLSVYSLGGSADRMGDNNVYRMSGSSDNLGQYGLQCDMSWDFSVMLTDHRGVVFGNSTT
jgi:hypothetical protein